VSTVEHSIASFDAVRPWRTATVVLTLVAVLELAVILVAGVALLAGPMAEKAKEVAVGRTPAPAQTKQPRPQPPGAKAPRLARAETSVLVLNGNGVSGAAGKAAARLRMVGYLVGGVGTAPGAEYPHSLVMYRTGYRGEALRLARDLRLKVVGPLDGVRPKELMGAHLALVLGDR
jgi:hypothetical protein